MVELLEGFPPYVAAYKASGAISKEEYEKVVMARVNQVAAQYGQINFLVLLATSMDNYSTVVLHQYGSAIYHQVLPGAEWLFHEIKEGQRNIFRFAHAFYRYGIAYGFVQGFTVCFAHAVPEIGFYNTRHHAVYTDGRQFHGQCPHKAFHGTADAGSNGPSFAWPDARYAAG